MLFNTIYWTLWHWEIMLIVKPQLIRQTVMAKSREIYNSFGNRLYKTNTVWRGVSLPKHTSSILVSFTERFHSLLSFRGFHNIHSKFSCVSFYCYCICIFYNLTNMVSINLFDIYIFVEKLIKLMFCVRFYLIQHWFF